MAGRQPWRDGERRVGLEDVGQTWINAKKKTIHASEQTRPDVAQARQQWREQQPTLDPAKLVFLDETWTKTNMTRLYGRGPRGERVLGTVPHGHWKTSTFLAGLRHDRLVAPVVLDGAINGETFLAWVEQFLAPTLAPGDTVIADNLGSHKVAGVKEAIEARGARLVFLPSYSPDLNPIEMVFAKLKALLRRAAPRTRDALWNNIGAMLGRFGPQECAAYLKHCGYSHPV